MISSLTRIEKVSTPGDVTLQETPGGPGGIGVDVGVGAAQALGPATAGSWKLRPSGGGTAGTVGALTPLPLPSPLSQPWERGEGEHAFSHSGAGAEG